MLSRESWATLPIASRGVARAAVAKVLQAGDACRGGADLLEMIDDELEIAERPRVGDLEITPEALRCLPIARRREIVDVTLIAACVPARIDEGAVELVTRLARSLDDAPSPWPRVLRSMQRDETFRVKPATLTMPSGNEKWLPAAEVRGEGRTHQPGKAADPDHDPGHERLS